jgi:hypothetical protein
MPTPERSNDPRWSESWPRGDMFDERHPGDGRGSMSSRVADPGSTSGSSASAGEWWNRFAEANQPRRSRLPVITAAILALAVVVTVVVVHRLTTQPANSNSTVSRSSAPTTQLAQSADPGAEDRLLHLLPPGYVPAECAPVVRPDAMARMACGRSSNPGGPASATFTLVRDQAALRAAYNEIVRGLAIASCPGSIQSPGPWHTNATPEQPSGTLVCGFKNDVATVAWTTDGDLLVSVISADRQGPTLDDLYRWWSAQ